MPSPRSTVKLGSHLLRADFNALCDFEEATGVDVGSLSDRLQEGVSFVVLRSLVRAIGGFDSDQEAGDAVQAVGIAKASEAIGEALSAAFATDDEETGDADPKP